jgi:nitrogen regulatory protein PII
MKLVIAVIRPEQLPAVKSALFDAEVRHFTAMPVMGTASRTEQSTYRGVQKETSLFSRVRLEIALNDSRLESALNAISDGCMKSGGSGKIMVTELGDAMTVWTGQRGPRALH